MPTLAAAIAFILRPVPSRRAAALKPVSHRAVFGGDALPATLRFEVMDHFNATIKDGKLVKTRRGLQVSRQRFNGLSFVNASPRDTAAGPGLSGATGTPGSSQQEIKFVEEGSESQSEGGYRKDAAHSESSSGAQGQRRKRRTTRRAKSPATPGAGTPSRPSPTPFEERSFQVGQSSASQDILHIDPTLDSSATGTTGDVASDPESPLSDEDRALFSRYFDCTPRSMYPDETILAYNPLRGADFYSMVTEDRAAQHCVLMCGSIAVALDTQTEPKDLTYHISKICAILNRKLNQQHAADAVTLHCIAKLACVGCYLGRLDHWQLHMCGLQKVLDLNGGLTGLPPWLLAEMYKADLRGAVALVSSPYLSFIRQYSPVSDVVSPEVRKQTSASISALLSPLHIHPLVIESLASLSTFTSAIRLARRSPSTAIFDPHAFTEEWQALTHVFLSQPGPLRDDPSPLNPYSTELSNPSSYISNHRLCPSVPITPAQPPQGGDGNPLEPALRLAALLHLKELLPDWPRNLGGYAVLLSLLRHHLHTLTDQHGEPSPPPQPELTTTTTTTTNHNKTLLKPLILFLTILGDAASRTADANEGRVADGERYPREVFRTCLARVGGVADAAAVEELTGADLAMVRLFGLGMVFGGGAGEGGEEEDGEGWDVKGVVRGIVVGDGLGARMG
ncbi:hypothetical protein B0I37DRAFT_413552 [Chaetomium sp. MPI-CAGE-AT-0009]|nr:hypothetical protein B0I37DRAFT_413552 [Chaetomium sp. MPI-CAGE-AT-0009]